LTVIGWPVGIDRRLGGGGGFGFAAIQTPFQFADLPFEEFHLLGQLGFTLDRTQMKSTPIVGLLTQLAEVQPHPPQGHEGEKEEQREPAKASPQPGGKIGFGIKDKSVLLRRQNNQRIGIGVHALPIVGSV